MREQLRVRCHGNGHVGVGVQSLPGVGRRTSDRLSATRSTNTSRDADAFLPSGHPIGSGAHRSSPLPSLRSSSVRARRRRFSADRFLAAVTFHRVPRSNHHPASTDRHTDRHLTAAGTGKEEPDNGRWADPGGCRLGNRIDMLQCAHWAKCSAHGGGLGPAIRGFGLPIASARPKRETGHLNSFCKGTTDWLAGCR